MSFATKMRYSIPCSWITHAPNHYSSSLSAQIHSLPPWQSPLCAPGAGLCTPEMQVLNHLFIEVNVQLQTRPPASWPGCSEVQWTFWVQLTSLYVIWGLGYTLQLFILSRVLWKILTCAVMRSMVEVFMKN